MSVSTVHRVHDVPRLADHPLARITAEEITQARQILEHEGLVSDSTRFVYFGLEEPHKREVLKFDEDNNHKPNRQIRVQFLDRNTGESRDAVVCLTTSSLAKNHIIDPVEDGQVPLLDEEFQHAEEIVAASSAWHEALRRRGLDPEKTRGVPLSAGYFGNEAEIGRRIARVVGFYQQDEKDLPWAHPIDGLVAYADLISGEIIELVDIDEPATPMERGEWNAAPHGSSDARTSLKPLEITQPEGASFVIENDVITWENWSMRIGFDHREGLVLNQVSYLDGDRRRSIVYRASVAEMVVLYADPSPARYFQNYFDTGEYMFNRYTNSLILGCDCLGEIHYLDAVMANDFGEPRTVKNAICIHEEDYGLLWKHNDMFNNMSESRRSRRLVISSFTTIGNYDYGFYWYFYQDGTIQLETKATGVVFTNSVPNGTTAASQEIAPGLGAPFHQHMLCARLDMAVDGLNNAVDEVEAQRIPMGPENPYGNAFTRKTTRLKTESEGQRVGSSELGRTWHVVNPEAKNRLGESVAYTLHSENDPLILADEQSYASKRANFATKHLWVTQYDPSERFPAGDFVYQNLGGAGLPKFTETNRSIDGEDIVLWHTFGLTHYPRPEDWPVMPMDYCGFKLKPYGFFDRNPALDLPAGTSQGSHCHVSDH